MKKLLLRHYISCLNRGVITPNTSLDDFIDKMDEELNEIKDTQTDEELYQETIDLIMVCMNMLRHQSIDIKNELLKNVLIQEDRANDLQ